MRHTSETRAPHLPPSHAACSGAARPPWRTLRARLVATASELARAAEDAGPIDWRHPAWSSLVAFVAAVEVLARGEPLAPSSLYPAYLSADAGPRNDTFMACRSPADAGAPEPGDALARADALVRRLGELEGALPGQPLGVLLRRRRGALERVPAGRALDRVACVASRGAVLAPLRSDARGAVLRALATWLGSGAVQAPLTAVDPRAAQPTPAVAAVALDSVPLDRARHVQRCAWTRAGGPWLGLGSAPGFDTLSTCHLVVDGYGHALLARTVLARPALRRPSRSPPLAIAGVALGVAVAELERAPRFSDAAFAFARMLDAEFGGAGGHACAPPNFQVPLVPGARDGRRLERVLHAVVRHPRDETRAAFAERLRAQLARERLGRGFLTRLLSATLRAPLPAGVRRRWLAARARPTRLLPAVERLGGRGRLSFLSLEPGEAPERPLFAVSGPALEPTRADPRGGCVLTLLAGPRGTAAALAGNGSAGDPAGAERALAAWLRELAALETSAVGAAGGLG